MAEASPGGSSLSLTIDKSLLECSICCGPFDDPRSLPCLHPFCCGCLENWAKTCSKDKKTLSCPLCKKVYRIPAVEGIKGFPAHFLVADLQNSVEKASQKSSICEEHGEKKIYFCETCGCAACSDCTALDPDHQGHTFIRLKQAAEQQCRSLENLVRKVQDVEQNCKTAIEKAKQMKLDLNKVTKEKIEALNGARNEYMQQGNPRGNHGNKNHVLQVNKLVKAYRQEVYHKRKVQLETIKYEEDIHCSDLTAIRSSCELATNVAESGSDIDIISLYPSLTLTLEQLAQHQVPAIDSTWSQIQIESPICETADLASLELLLCDKLHIQVPLSSKIRARIQTIHLSPKPVKAARNPLPSSQPASSAASKVSLSSSPPANAGETAATYSASSTATESRKGIPRGASWFSGVCRVLSVLGWFFCFIIAFSFLFWIYIQSAPYLIQQEIGSWKKWETIKIDTEVKDPGITFDIAVHPNGDFAVTSQHAPVAVFSRAGNFKFSIKGSPTGIISIAVTPNNHYIIPGLHGTEVGLFRYDSQGNLIEITPTFDMYTDQCKPTSVAVDSTGRVIAGEGDCKTVSIYQPEGTPISTFETHARPLFITCAPDDRLIISFDDHTLQVMDQSGHNASIIEPPPDVLPWHPLFVCCSKQGELFVTTYTVNHGLFRFVSNGGEFMYSDRIMSTDIELHQSLWNEQLLGIAFSADEEELFVVSKWTTWEERSYVKIFRYQ